MTPPPRPRMYALMLSQLIGFFIIIFGMLPYWFHTGGATVPQTITRRVAGICFVVLISVGIPFWKNSRILKGLSSEEEDRTPGFADSSKNVRIVLWAYSIVDVVLLTYAVHITGGITGSPYTGMFLMLPAVALFLKGDPLDTKMVQWLTMACGLAIVLSAWMSYYNKIEIDCSRSPHAFVISVCLVTVLALTIPGVQIMIFRAQEERERRKTDVGNGQK